MANGTMKGRQSVRQADKQFPGHRIAVQSAVSPAAEMASLREARARGDATFDTSKMAWMLPFNRRKIAQEYEQSRDGRFNFREVASEREQLSGMLKASQSNKAISDEVASYRQFEITSDILAIPFALSAFQSINLSADELVQIITPQARQYFTVRYMGQDGGARSDQWRTTRSALEIEMRLISTDKVEYSLMDLQHGDVNQFSAINEQLRHDLEFKVDEMARDMMDAGQVNSGLRDLLNVHPSIDITNIPDSNYLDLTDVPTFGAANTWTLARLKAMLNRMAMWGYGLDPAGPISITTMIMSPQNARDSWDYIDLISDTGNPLDTVTSGQRESILSNGSLLSSAWGYNWQTQYNHRVAKGRAYVMTNQPIGWYFTKTEWDRVIEWKDMPDNIERNLAEILMRKALQFYMPDLWAYRYLIIDF